MPTTDPTLPGAGSQPQLHFSHICARSFDASLSRGPREAGPCFRIFFCNNNAASSAGSSGSVTGSRQNTMRIQPTLPSIFLHGFALQCRTCAATCTGELFTTLPSQQVFHRRHVLWRQPFGCRQAAQKRHPYVHERGTELFVSLYAFCLGSVLDGARCFVTTALPLPLPLPLAPRRRQDRF